MKTVVWGLLIPFIGTAAGAACVFFLRFALMLYIWKAFDIVCLDWLLLTRSHFFQRYYPETEGCAGYHQFGFNRKEQITRIILFPFVAALMAGIALWIGG